MSRSYKLNWVCGIPIGAILLADCQGGLMAELRRDNTATFHFEEGNVDSAPGPRIAGYYDDPYYSCYRFSLPLSAPESGDRMSLLNAYAWLYDVIADAAAFDGILASPMGAFWRPDF